MDIGGLRPPVLLQTVCAVERSSADEVEVGLLGRERSHLWRHGEGREQYATHTCASSTNHISDESKTATADASYAMPYIQCHDYATQLLRSLNAKKHNPPSPKSMQDVVIFKQRPWYDIPQTQPPPWNHVILFNKASSNMHVCEPACITHISALAETPPSYPTSRGYSVLHLSLDVLPLLPQTQYPTCRGPRSLGSHAATSIWSGFDVDARKMVARGALMRSRRRMPCRTRWKSSMT
jgi:hypothetical protein